ncbi:MAG: glycosyltransferase family 4 protein [Bacteroidota bacterium]
MKNKKTVILYRVVQNWRAPFFDLLNKEEDLDVAVWHGPDFPNSKVISTKKSYAFKRKKLISFKLRFKSSNGEVLMPFSPFLFFALIFKNPSVIISEGASNLPNALQGFLYAKIFRKKFIWWSLGKIKNREFGKTRSKLDSIVQFIEKRADAIISYSSRGKEYFEYVGVKEEKIFTAVNVVDTKKIIANLKNIEAQTDIEPYNSPYEFTLLFVGALTKEKSIDTLLHALSKLDAYKDKIGLFVVGDGSYRNELETLAKDLQLSNIHFFGKRIEDSHLFWRAADLFVLPGLGGLAISEAMCYSLPVLCSIGDGCEVDLVTKENGIIEEAMTPESLSKHILWFYNNQEQLPKMKETSLSIIENKYNTDNYIKRIKDAINS